MDHRDSSDTSAISNSSQNRRRLHGSIRDSLLALSTTTGSNPITSQINREVTSCGTAEGSVLAPLLLGFPGREITGAKTDGRCWAGDFDEPAVVAYPDDVSKTEFYQHPLAREMGLSLDQQTRLGLVIPKEVRGRDTVYDYDTGPEESSSLKQLSDRARRSSPMSVSRGSNMMVKVKSLARLRTSSQIERDGPLPTADLSEQFPFPQVPSEVQPHNPFPPGRGRSISTNKPKGSILTATKVRAKRTKRVEKRQISNPVGPVAGVGLYSPTLGDGPFNSPQSSAPTSPAAATEMSPAIMSTSNSVCASARETPPVPSGLENSEREPRWAFRLAPPRLSAMEYARKYFLEKASAEREGRSCEITPPISIAFYTEHHEKFIILPKIPPGIPRRLVKEPLKPTLVGVNCDFPSSNSSDDSAETTSPRTTGLGIRQVSRHEHPSYHSDLCLSPPYATADFPCARDGAVQGRESGIGTAGLPTALSRVTLRAEDATVQESRAREGEKQPWNAPPTRTPPKVPRFGGHGTLLVPGSLILTTHDQALLSTPLTCERQGKNPNEEHDSLAGQQQHSQQLDTQNDIEKTLHPTPASARPLLVLPELAPMSPLKLSLSSLALSESEFEMSFKLRETPRSSRVRDKSLGFRAQGPGQQSPRVKGCGWTRFQDPFITSPSSVMLSDPLTTQSHPYLLQLNVSTVTTGARPSPTTTTTLRVPSRRDTAMASMLTSESSSWQTPRFSQPLDHVDVSHDEFPSACRVSESDKTPPQRQALITDFFPPAV